MQYTTIITSTLALLSTTASAVSINRARAAEPQPASTSSYPSYTLSYSSQYAGYQTLYSAADGTISTTLSPGDVLISIAVNNPADNANCVVRDVWGNQIRAFGGPGQEVNSIDFVQNDGKQVRYIACVPAY